VTSFRGQLNWVLIPYVHQPSAKLMKAFDDALKDEFGNIDKKTITRTAKDPKVREKLCNCYDALWLDHNLISMTLYAGPIKGSPARIEMGIRYLTTIGVGHMRRAVHQVGC